MNVIDFPIVVQKILYQFHGSIFKVNLSWSSAWAKLCRIIACLFVVLPSDAARPLSYKTKTTYFFKTKTGQVKTKAKTTGVARNFDWEGPKLEKILWRYLGDVFGGLKDLRRFSV